MKNLISWLGLTWLSLSCTPAFAESEHLSAALVDVAGAKICDRLQDRYRGLKREKSNGDSVYSGTLWIHSCQAIQDEKQHDVVTFELGVKGWRWVDREKEKLGAEFGVSEFARFNVDVGLTGKVNANYDPEAKRMALWFNPVEKPKVDLNASGEIDVEKEGMWGTVLAGAATLVGQSPESMVDEQLAKKGEERFTEKMSEGFSAAIDLCSGRVFSELGQLDKDTLFAKIEEKQRAEFQTVELNPSSFLLFGPYGEQSKELDLQLRMNNSENFSNKLICLEDAVKLSQAYMEGEDPLPELSGLGLVQADDPEGEASLRNKDQTCPVVAMFASAENVKENSTFEFRVRDFGEPEPLIKCE